ncbi:MAG TPA: septum formation initiator family protein [Candidatus Dormibacteraeota bacterium]|nr:septum formation initiator family protein [Candidatus Dormibacteraeota bacterium]
MRQTTIALAPPGVPRPRLVAARRTIVFVVVLFVAAWAAVGYAQEAYLGHRLSQQVSDLRQQNQVLAQQNQGYRRDINATNSGAADEEEARRNGYSKPYEHVYLVTGTPSPAPPSPKASPTP